MANPTCPHSRRGVLSRRRLPREVRKSCYCNGALLLEQDTRIKTIEHQLTSITTQLSHIGRIVTGLANQHTL